MTASARRSGPLAPLRHRDFRLLLLGTTFDNLVLPLQLITMTFWAIEVYPGQKVLFPGLIGATRGLGMILFGLLGGAIADRFERRYVLRATAVIACSTTAALSFCMLQEPFGGATIGVVLALVFVGAANMGIDAPARTSSIPAIAGVQDVAPALGLNNVAQQMSFPLIVPFVGVANGTIGPAAVYAWSTTAWLVTLPAMFSLRFSTPRTGTHRRRLIGDIREGVAYARRDATILAVLAMVFTIQVVGMPGVAMLGPVWMTEVLGLSKAQFGWVAMLWGVGAVISSIFFARFHHLAGRGLSLCTTVTVFAVAAVVYGHSRYVPLTATANLGLGFAMAGTLVVGLTIVQQTVREEFRGRVMGLFPLIGGLSMLNTGPVSAAGQAVGLEVVVPALGWATLILAVLIFALRPGLRRMRPVPAEIAIEAPATVSVGGPS